MSANWQDHRMEHAPRQADGDNHERSLSHGRVPAPYVGYVRGTESSARTKLVGRGVALPSGRSWARQSRDQRRRHAQTANLRRKSRGWKRFLPRERSGNSAGRRVDPPSWGPAEVGPAAVGTCRCGTGHRGTGED